MPITASRMAEPVPVEDPRVAFSPIVTVTTKRSHPDPATG